MRRPSRPAPSARGALLSTLAAVGGLALSGCGGGPVEITPPPAAASAACSALAARLPADLGGLAAVRHTPEDAPGGAWGDPAITLTCGVAQPADFGPASSCITVDGVDWFAPDGESTDNGSDITLTSVTLRPRVALHVPARYRGGVSAAALTDLAAPLRSTLTATTRCQ